MAEIIGICGKAGSGKDTMVEEYLKRPNHPLAQRFSFGDGVKHSAAAIFREPIGKFYEHKEEVSEQWGISYREMLQKLGTEFARDMIDKDFWVKWLHSKIQGIPPAIQLVFITDVRFDNEADWVHARGGVVIECVRQQETNLGAEEEHHSSENGISAHLIDYRITNDNTIEILGNRLETALATMFKLGALFDTKVKY